MFSEIIQKIHLMHLPGQLNQSLLYFVQMMKAITGTEWAGKVPSDLPIYNIGGDQDPVDEYKEGIL